MPRITGLTRILVALALAAATTLVMGACSNPDVTYHLNERGNTQGSFTLEGDEHGIRTVVIKIIAPHQLDGATIQIKGGDCCKELTRGIGLKADQSVSDTPAEGQERFDALAGILILEIKMPVTGARHDTGGRLTITKKPKK